MGSSSFAMCIRPLSVVVTVVMGFGLLSTTGLAPLEAQSSDERVLLDPERIEGAEACGECHIAEFERWRQTPHSTSFGSRHRTETAEEIAGKMGLPLIKRNSICLRCHYTPERVGEQLRAASGPSCESCHGEGSGWIEVHNDYGDAEDFASESQENRDRRIEASRAAGMRRPSDLYPVVASCYECHFVLNQEVVDVGGHSVGPPSFDLIEGTQGVNRHNFLAAQRGGSSESSENREASPERLRLLYATGQALDLEYTLRGAARATTDGTYLRSLKRRARGSQSSLRELARHTGLEPFQQMATIARAADIDIGNSQRLLEAADAVREQTLALLDAHDGSQLQSLDPFLRGEPPPPLEVTDDDLGDDVDRDADPAGGSEADPVAGEETTDVAAAETAADAVSADTEAGGTPDAASAQPVVVGEKKSRIRPRSSHRTLGGACSSCHGPQNEWWFSDAHFVSADPFFDETSEVLAIASLYGVSRGALVRGDTVCMDCHGTVATGRERREVQDGVGCESCHGAAGDFLEPHQEGEKELGRERPGFVKALDLGMNDLQNLEVRLNTCSGCHYVTDERLISSGHPSGRDFDYASGMTTIQHWEGSAGDSAQVLAAARAALNRRGPVPDVVVARLPDPVGVSSPAANVAAATPAAARDVSADRPTRVRPSRAPSRSAPERPREAPERGFAEAAAPEGELAPLAVDDDASPLDLLRAIERRLEAIYRWVAGDGREEQQP